MLQRGLPGLGEGGAEGGQESSHWQPPQAQSRGLTSLRKCVAQGPGKGGQDVQARWIQLPPHCAGDARRPSGEASSPRLPRVLSLRLGASPREAAPHSVGGGALRGPSLWVCGTPTSGQAWVYRENTNPEKPSSSTWETSHARVSQAPGRAGEGLTLMGCVSSHAGYWMT